LQVPSHGLLEWLLSQDDKQVRGFARAIFSGLTTHELARVVALIIRDFPRLHGLYHVAGDPINKFDLLELIRRVYDLRIELERDETQVCDRSLVMDRFHEATLYVAPGWAETIDEMRQDATPYADFHRNKRN
jgi:dTDP-4-dehydrorhamnose reductase